MPRQRAGKFDVVLLETQQSGKWPADLEVEASGVAPARDSSEQGLSAVGKWYLFLGDSQARTLLYSLMLLQGHSPWRTQPQSDEDVWSPASAEPGGKSWSTDQLLPSGSCSGDLSTITRELEWNMPLAPNRTCMHDHHFNGSRYSFIFLTRVRNTWARCATSQTFRREQRAPDALIVAHYNWPLIFDSGAGIRAGPRRASRPLAAAPRTAVRWR